MSHIWLIEVNNLHADSAEFFVESFEGYADSTSCFENTDKTWTVSLYLQNEPKKGEIERKMHLISAAFNIDAPEFAIKQIENENWVALSQQNFKPITIGNFYITPNWHETDEIHNKHIIKIDPEMAFGTGSHNTTKSCLIMLNRLGEEHNFKNILDLGTGTGVLAIGAAKIWSKAAIIAADYDEIAVTTAARNIEQNQASNIKIIYSEGFSSDDINRPYDLIIANILAKPLIEMAEDFYRYIDKDRLVILSGFYEKDLELVFSEFAKYDFQMIDKIIDEDWASVVLRSSK